VGTVTDDVEKAVSESKAGKIEYRTDRQAIVHLAIGKASFDAQKLLENYAAVMEEITKAKPASSKGRYIISVSVATTMGPGIPVDPSKATEKDIFGESAATTADPAGSGSSGAEPESTEEPAESAEDSESVPA
jgi:large subunit ribosomal protein L1